MGTRAHSIASPHTASVLPASVTACDLGRPLTNMRTRSKGPEFDFGQQCKTIFGVVKGDRLRTPLGVTVTTRPSSSLLPTLQRVCLPRPILRGCPRAATTSRLTRRARRRRCTA
jgi:hypothetical protein